jgi:hypothetical protein
MAKETFSFEVVPIKETPSRVYKKGSKYDPILDNFTEGGHPLGKIKVTKKKSGELLDANYLRTQLTKRITARELTTVKAKVVNGECYLELVAKD